MPMMVKTSTTTSTTTRKKKKKKKKKKIQSVVGVASFRYERKTSSSTTAQKKNRKKCTAQKKKKEKENTSWREVDLSLSLSVFSRVSQKSPSRLSLYVFRGEKNRIFMTRFLRNLQLFNSLSGRAVGLSTPPVGKKNQKKKARAER